jgi:hypothetical protein
MSANRKPTTATSEETQQHQTWIQLLSRKESKERRWNRKIATASFYAHNAATFGIDGDKSVECIGQTDRKTPGLVPLCRPSITNCKWRYKKNDRGDHICTHESLAAFVSKLLLNAIGAEIDLFCGTDDAFRKALTVNKNGFMAVTVRRLSPWSVFGIQESRILDCTVLS